MGRKAAVAFVLCLLLAGCSTGYAPGAGVGTAPESDTESPTSGEDHLGYVDGYWYNDTFDIDPETGLTDAELEAVVSRAMARVQLLRGLAFEERIEVELVTRETFRTEYADAFGGGDDGASRLENAEYEALFLVGPDEDVAEVRQRNRGDNILGFYAPGSEEIVVVSEGDTPTLEDEMTLAHELLHALQDQHFGLGSPADTRDEHTAYQGLIEGDAVVVERAYERNCETGEWQCVEIEDSGETSIGPDFHFGVYFLGFAPYAEGPSFIEHHRDRGGWTAINEMYDAMPRHGAEIVHPETYGTDRYETVDLSDRHGDGYERVRPDGSDHASLGQTGLATMFAYTLYDDYNEVGVIEQGAFLNRNEDGTLDDTRPFTYDVDYAEGWHGDRLHAYQDGSETAYVWSIEFQDTANATEFRGGYEDLIEHWGGETAGTAGGGDVWRIADDDSPFDGVIWVRQDDERVTIVGAPTAEDLGSVYAPAG
ncbi:MAG: Hvo_1808 family surface protein [Natronomonas sp.]